jgi:hypothetical protein
MAAKRSGRNTFAEDPATPLSALVDVILGRQ